MSILEPGSQPARGIDSLGAELESMRQIARALDSLHDPEARQRVLQWASERYRVVVTQPEEFAAEFRRFALEWQGA
jgi:hypothetical protein